MASPQGEAVDFNKWNISGPLCAVMTCQQVFSADILPRPANEPLYVHGEQVLVMFSSYQAHKELNKVNLYHG